MGGNVRLLGQCRQSHARALPDGVSSPTVLEMSLPARIIGLVLLVSLAASCGGDDGDGDESSQGVPTTTEAASTEPDIASSCSDEEGDAVLDGVAISDGYLDLTAVSVAPGGRSLEVMFELADEMPASARRFFLHLDFEEPFGSSTIPSWSFATSVNRDGSTVTEIDPGDPSNAFNLVSGSAEIDGRRIRIVYDLEDYEGSPRIRPLRGPVSWRAFVSLSGNGWENVTDACGDAVALDGLDEPTAVAMTIPSERPGKPRLTTVHARQSADALLEAWQFGDAEAGATYVVDSLSQDPFSIFGDMTPVQSWRIDDCAGATEPGETGEWQCEAVDEQSVVQFVLVGENVNDGFKAIAAVSTASPSETTSPPTSPAPASSPVHFQSPSGNIACYLAEDGVACQIAGRGWEPPPAPEDCEFDWGNEVYLADEATFSCSSDSLFGAPTVLDYGDSVSLGRITCASSEAGVECGNSESQRGFVLGRQSYRIY